MEQNWQKRAVIGFAAPQLSQYISFVVISFPFDAIAVTSPQYSTFQPCDWDQYWLLAAMPALPYFSGEAHASANCEAAYGAGRNHPAQGERSYHAARVSAVPRPSYLYAK